MSSEEMQAKKRALSGEKSAQASKEALLVRLIELARRNCVKRLVFEGIELEMDVAPQLGTPFQTPPPSFEPQAPSTDLESVPERPTPKAFKLNADYDAWSAATPRPIFEKKES